MGTINDSLSYLADKVALIGKHLTMSRTPWSSGSCTIEDSSKYIAFLVYAGSPMIALPNEDGSIVAGYSVLAATSTAQYIRTFTAAVSGDTWTLTNVLQMGHNANGNHGGGTTPSISFVVGLIPKAEV